MVCGVWLVLIAAVQVEEEVVSGKRWGGDGGRGGKI
jgi:hypothetical protein